MQIKNKDRIDLSQSPKNFYICLTEQEKANFVKRAVLFITKCFLLSISVVTATKVSFIILHLLMKISYNWLKQYLDTDLTADEMSVVLTDIGLEVEGMETWQSVKGGLEGLVIGEVKTCERHPNADKLSKTTVDIGGEVLPVVCGAPNVAAGQKVVVATVGTTLYSGDDSFVIKKSKIRGEASQGMICAEDEIGVGESHDGIMVLPEDTAVGTLAKDFFPVENDVIFEIGLTPNRIDAASHFGTARDVAAYLQVQGKGKLTRPSVDDFKVDNNDLIIPIEVKNTEACPRYTGLTISGIEVKESPDWLKNRLLAIGQRPINNVVDVTNYVLQETGHPLHAFDAAEVSGGKVIVGTLDEGSKFVSLDEEERELSDKDLMICNDKGGMCIAGVFGGVTSGVKEGTTDIFLESAYFNPVWVRKTAKRHGLNTDASFRFERGADPNITPYALKRAALLIQEVAGGKISSEIEDVYPTAIEDFKFEVRYSHIDRLIGKHIEKDLVKKILTALEIVIESEEDDVLQLTVPAYRVDVQREADIIEEILRIYGYNNVEIPEKVNSSLSYKQDTDRANDTQNKISDFLASMGFNEAMSNSLTKSEYVEGMETLKSEENVKILNPLSLDLDAMRQTLLFGGLEAICRNINYQNADIRLFEFGNIYKFSESFTKTPLPKYFEEKRLALFLSGNKSQESWNLKVEPTTFFELKSYVEAVLKRLGFNLGDFTQEEIQNDQFSTGLVYQLNGKEAVTFGYVHPKLLNKFDIEAEVFYADIAWDLLLAKKPNAMRYQEIPKFPKVRRDLALLVDNTLRFAELKKKALATEKKLLKEVGLFDVYEGQGIPDGKRSYALNFILQDESKTLTDKQIDKIMNKMISVFEREFGAQLR